ncbi:hypothetical protein N7510_003969 [Penicillium lagena]|uniref:uncharacterized protein n=1 Tax=Penicillium lagena TaxID=94218 RepID=UPI00254064D1|nr:uncharacterized protein N7510_003969 [Penicillium lagena]KAJ5619985.1 hypothetical protein N7510_003969 [Penicillium lagena]
MRLSDERSSIASSSKSVANRRSLLMHGPHCIVMYVMRTLRSIENSRSCSLDVPIAFLQDRPPLLPSRPPVLPGAMRATHEAHLVELHPSDRPSSGRKSGGKRRLNVPAGWNRTDQPVKADCFSGAGTNPPVQQDPRISLFQRAGSADGGGEGGLGDGCTEDVWIQLGNISTCMTSGRRPQQIIN